MSWKYSSPNFSSRHQTPVDTILIHHTGGMMPGCAQWLCNPNPKDSDGNPVGRVSAHYVIDRSGLIYELIDVYKCAWHAGRGAFDLNHDGTISEDEKRFNQRSVGIELESKGDTYTDVQLVALQEIIAHVKKIFNIHTDHILGHKEIAPDRKWDPGRFSMPHLRNTILSFTRIRENE